MKRVLMCVIAVLASLTVFSEEYGQDRTKCESRYFVSAGDVTIRRAPSNSAAKDFVGELGDIFYVESNDVIKGEDGSLWLKISDVEEKYVPYSAVTREDNPYYVKPLDDEEQENNKKGVSRR